MKIIYYAYERGEFPENTLEAIQNCQDTNINWHIEMDINLTRNNKLMLLII